MEYPYIDLIPAIIKSHIPSVYEGESFTSLEYVSKVSHKMNEVVDEFNSFVKSVCDEVDKYKNCTDKDIDLFKRTIEQKFADFINVIELKYQKQDLIISNAVNELTSNASIILKEVLTSMFKGGELDVVILEAVNDLEGQFDNLNKSFTTFQNNVNTSITGIVTDINTFKSNMNDEFNDYKEEVNNNINEIRNDVGSADMSKSVYDTDNSGVVDNAEKLGGNLPSYYAKNTDLEKANSDISLINTTMTSIAGTANNAFTTASTAKSNADTALSLANSMENDVVTAKNNATKALNDSSTALTKINEAVANSILEYTHSENGLTGSGNFGKFKAAINETISSIYVNGVICEVKCGSENTIELIEGNWYIFILDGATINFNSGGGLSNSKLAQATAIENTVLKGYTFFAGDKDLKIGTLEIPETNYDENGNYYLIKNGIILPQIYSGEYWQQKNGYVQVSFISGSYQTRTLGNSHYVDITEYSAVVVKCSALCGDGTARERTLYLHNPDGDDVKSQSINTADKATYELNVSNVSGFVRIGLRGRYSYSKVTDVYLKK